MNDARNDDSCCGSCCIICISSKHHVYKLAPIIIYKICRKARTKKVSELHQTLFFPTHNQKEKKRSGYETRCTYCRVHAYGFDETRHKLATRMAALLGSIDQFDPSLEDWANYVERLGQFFEANGIVGDSEDIKKKRRSTFLSVVGPGPYKLLRSILTPVKPSEKTFEQLTEVLKNHYNPPPSEVMQRFRFNTRSRKPGESVATYVAELRRLAEFCGYGETLEKMIRDRLVTGINDDNIQKKLLSEPALTYNRA